MRDKSLHDRLKGYVKFYRITIIIVILINILFFFLNDVNDIFKYIYDTSNILIIVDMAFIACIYITVTKRNLIPAIFSYLLMPYTILNITLLVNTYNYNNDILAYIIVLRIIRVRLNVTKKLEKESFNSAPSDDGAEDSKDTIKVSIIEKSIKTFVSALLLLKSVFHKKADMLYLILTFAIVVIFTFSTLIYFVELPHNDMLNTYGDCVWWCVVSLTTIGYGDIYPVTTLGRIITSIMAFFGIGLIAIPGGILGSGFIEEYDNNNLLNNGTKEDLEKFISDQNDLIEQAKKKIKELDENNTN